MTEPTNPTPTPDPSATDKIVGAINALTAAVRGATPLIKELIVIGGMIWLAIQSWRHGQTLDTVEQKTTTAVNNTNEVKSDTKIAVETAAENKVTATKTLATMTGDPKDERAAVVAQAQLEHVKAAATQESK